MKNISQYTHNYLDCNRSRGWDKGLTVGSFLAYTLRGKAKSWISRYARSLERSVLLVGAVEGRSKYGKTAYYPA